MNVLGIDLSSKAIDLVLLDENADRASWTRITLEGPTAFERTRSIPELMPQPGWYEEHGVYLIGLEEPMGFSSAMLGRVFGAVLASLPRELVVWPVRPASWKNALGLKQNQKPTWEAFPSFGGLSAWKQDSLDALGIALHVRDVNASGIAAALKGAA